MCVRNTRNGKPRSLMFEVVKKREMEAFFPSLDVRGIRNTQVVYGEDRALSFVGNLQSEPLDCLEA